MLFFRVFIYLIKKQLNKNLQLGYYQTLMGLKINGLCA